ncbi:MAG: glycosyltransferase family 4 protein [Candidatus Aenigmatarchaeota archaeon]
MKILMLTWEYPPHKVGGVGSHCKSLAETLEGRGHDVTVLTYGEKEKRENQEDVEIYRVSAGPADDVVTWSLMLNHEIQKKATELIKEGEYDLVHAHDWSSVPAATAIKKGADLPMVFTIHSTERGRSGIHSDMSRLINDLEWYGTYEADQVITVGKDLKGEVQYHFSVPDEKLHYVPNGVDMKRFKGAESVRDEIALDWEDMVLYVGRLCHQKGVRHLIHAMPKVLKERPETKFIFTGGGAVDKYRNMARNVGVEDKAYFTGFVPEERLVDLYKSADATVMPSIYEPFGIVALESMAVETPVVASYVGGLKETVVHEWCGLHTYPSDPDSIDWGIQMILSDKTWNNWMGEKGKERVEENYRWEMVAELTDSIYKKTVGDEEQ